MRSGRGEERNFCIRSTPVHPVHVELASMNCAEAETTPNDPARREEKNGQTGDPLRGGYLPLLSSPDFHPSINRFLFTTTEKQSVLLRTEESEKGGNPCCTKFCIKQNSQL